MVSAEASINIINVFNLLDDEALRFLQQLLISALRNSDLLNFIVQVTVF